MMERNSSVTRTYNDSIALFYNSAAISIYNGSLSDYYNSPVTDSYNSSVTDSYNSSVTDSYSSSVTDSYNSSVKDSYNISITTTYNETSVRELVLFSSTAEATFSALYLILAIAIAVLGNALVLFQIIRTNLIAEPQFFILFVYSLADIFIVMAAVPVQLLVTLHESVYVVSDDYCRAQMWLASSATSVCYHMLSLLAIERYFYFCRPFAYERIFTVRHTAWLAVGICALAVLAGGYWSLGELVTLNPAFLLCAPANPSRAAVILMTLVYIVPSCTVFIVCPWRIHRLVKSKVAPPTVQSTATTGPTTAARPTIGFRRSLRTILLTSGIFVLTYLPNNIISNYALMLAPRAFTVEHFHLDGLMMASRVTRYIQVTLSPILDPFVIVYINRKRMFKREGSIADVATEVSKTSH